MKKVKKFFYPFKTIIIPLLLITLLSIWLSSFFTLIDYEGNGFIIKLSELTFNHPRRFACIILFIAGLVFIRKINKEKEFAPTDIYGDYSIFIYYIAWLVVGYKKVNLKLKPIPLQFQLLSINFLECFDDTKYFDRDYEYKVSYKGKINKNTKEINIVLSDTYPIEMNKLPNNVINNYTILISRDGEKGIRIISKKLIELLIKEVQKSKEYCRKFNLFLSTPASTNKLIFEQVFQTGLRDKFIINIYQQDNENNFMFKEKSTRIKC